MNENGTELYEKGHKDAVKRDSDAMTSSVNSIGSKQKQLDCTYFCVLKSRCSFAKDNTNSSGITESLGTNKVSPHPILHSTTALLLQKQSSATILDA